MKFDDWLELLGDAVIIAFSCVLVFQFVTIQIFGIYGQEHNKAILYSEIVTSILFICLGIKLLIKDIKKRR